MVLSGGERAESWRMSRSMSFRMLVASAEVNDMLKTVQDTCLLFQPWCC